MSFDDQRKQKPIADRLRHSLENGRLAHAYLFSGPRGAGKEVMARTLAKAVNCLKKKHDSCDRCDSCRRIDENTHPDVYWVRPELKSRRIGVGQIREFERAINLKPMIARVKVGIVADADCMGDEASNAFLKTLEEPPHQTIILLLTTQPQRLLPTILSRCLKIAFGESERTQSPYRAKLAPLLAKFSAEDQRGIVPPYQLLGELTGLLQGTRDEIRASVEAELNLDRYEEIDSKVRERLETQMEARIEGEYRAVREQILEEIYTWFGDLLLCVEGADETLLAHHDQANTVRRAAAKLDYRVAARNLDRVERIRDSLARNVPETLALEVGLLKLATT